jgi:ribonuclease P/MRP protein subunit POP1
MRRNREFKWLETHLWMAKRMKMEDYFGYKVAHNCIDKSGRACYRFNKNESIMIDKSFYFII